MKDISKNIKNMFEIFQNDADTSVAVARNKVIDAFLGSDSRISSTEIFDILKNEQQIISKAFVFKVMKKLCLYNIAHTDKNENGEIVYTHDHLKRSAAMFHCIKCNEEKEIEIDNKELFDITGKGFSPITMFNYDLVINGLCEVCQPERICVPLSNLQENVKAVIFEISGDSSKIKRLANMGFEEGKQLELLNVLNNSLIVKINGNRLSISQNLAKDILVISNL